MKSVILTLVLIITVVTIVGLLPLLSFATPENGDMCTTDYVDTLVGSDGAYYYRGGVQTSIKYNSDGSINAFSHENFSGTRKHYLIIPDNQAGYYGYCIEQGESFPDAQRYQGVDWNIDLYFSKLPKNVQTGIMLATIFGWQPGKNVPVGGCNNDDWYWATQIIIWEYQQKLRVSPSVLQSNGYVSSHYFQSTLAGRPAEKCYNYMLASMEKYEKMPSFAASSPEEAALIILKWNSVKSRWTATLKDINHTGQILISQDPSLKIEQNGDEYTFSSTSKQALKTVEFTKNISLPSDKLLIWSGATATQAIATGTADPIHFFAQFRSEEEGLFELIKSSEDGMKEDFRFQLTDQYGQVTDLSTDSEGSIHVPLWPGEYKLTELISHKYRAHEDLTIQMKENEKTHIEIINELKKGQIRIIKTVKNTLSHEMKAETGAIFQIFPEDALEFKLTPERMRDEIITDDMGIAISKELPLGNYIVHQIGAGKNITYSKDLVIQINEDRKTVQMGLDNYYQKGKIEVLKMNGDEHTLEGAVFTIRTSEDIYKEDGSLRYGKGTLLDTFVTDTKGLASTEWLYPGNYLIEEVIAPRGYARSINPITTVSLFCGNRMDATFLKLVQIKNKAEEQFPNTGDENRLLSSQNSKILMLMSLIGMVLLVYLMIGQNKTLH